MLLVSAILTFVSFFLPYAMVNVGRTAMCVHAGYWATKLTTTSKYNFYLLSWSANDEENCANADGNIRRISYDDTIEFNKLKSAGLTGLIMLSIGCLLTVIVAIIYFSQSNKFTRALFKPCKFLKIKTKTKIPLIIAVAVLVFNIVGMILWLVLFYAHNVSQWLAQDSPSPWAGFYLELLAIIVYAVAVIVAMFWRHA